MKPFVLDRYGRIVFPFNFLPELDFSVFDTLEEFEAVIRRDFEDKARPETEIVARLAEGGYRERYWLLRDLAGHLFWIDRYAMTMYERRPTRWRDVPRQRADVFLPRLIDVDAGPAIGALQAGYRGLPPGSDERAEDVMFGILLDVFRSRQTAGVGIAALNPTVGEALARCKGELACTNEDLVRNAAYCWSPMTAEEIRAKTGIVQRLYTELTLEELALRAARAALVKSGRQPEEIGAVLFCSCTSTRACPSVAAWISGQLGILQTHASYDLVAACAGLAYGLSEAARLLQESGRPALVVCAEKFSDKIGTVRASRMIFGDSAGALVLGPAPAGAPPDLEVFQTYASGPMSEVESIIWPNPAFDNSITVHGPQVRALVSRYLTQMVGELAALPDPDGRARSLLEAIDLVVPHQANKTMVTDLAREAGLPSERLYFNIERVGNTSAASIPLALHDAVHDGVIDRPLRVFAPGFGAGAVGGYVVMRVAPAIAA